MTAQLHVLLGAGGVGKTSLAAGYALALARNPSRRVGLLGIDPSRRLKDALHVALGDAAVAVPGVGVLQAALLQPAQALRRWASESSAEPGAHERLLANPFFAALADRLATATDIFAAARIAEWAERDPELTDLVVDTAPGLNAIEFLTRPERLVAFLGGRLVGWLRWVTRTGAGGASVGLLRGSAQRIVGALGRIAGAQLLLDLADFFSLVDAMFTRMLARVQVTQRWLRDPSTHILVVTSVRHDGARTARELVDALSAARLVARAVIVNRALPAALVDQRTPLEAAIATDPAAAPVLRYALAYAVLQARVVDGVAGLTPTTVVVPDARGLDGDARLESLTRLGEVLRTELEPREAGDVSATRATARHARPG